MNPNLIIYNAKIYTVDEQLPWAEAVACHNGRFLSIGTNDESLFLLTFYFHTIKGFIIVSP